MQATSASWDSGNGNNPTGCLRVYVDGAIVTTNNAGNPGCVAGFHYPNNVARSSLLVGRSAPGWSDPDFSGTMRDLHFWDVRLLAAEVADLHDAGKAGSGGVGTFPPSVLARPAPIVSKYATACLYYSPPPSHSRRRRLGTA